MKNVFYFILKAFKIFKSFLRYLNARLDFYGHMGKLLDKGTKVNFKIYEVTDWGKIHILRKISRNKDNQTITLGQLIDYNMKIIFL